MKDIKRISDQKPLIGFNDFIMSNNVCLGAQNCKYIADMEKFKERIARINEAYKNIVAVVLFGSSINKPEIKIEEIKYRRGFLWLKEKTRIYKNEIQTANDIDLLVITKKDILGHHHINSKDPVYKAYGDSSCMSCSEIVREGESGIDIIYRGIKQMHRGIESKEDTISISALKYGLILFKSPKFSFKIFDKYNFENNRDGSEAFVTKNIDFFLEAKEWWKYAQ